MLMLLPLSVSCICPHHPAVSRELHSARSALASAQLRHAEVAALGEEVRPAARLLPCCCLAAASLLLQARWAALTAARLCCGRTSA